jgi:tetratricopeptide (TPR) repeat protein
MQAAQAAGDLELQGTLLQHQARLHRRQGNHPRSVELFKGAIAIFQRANAPGDEMRTCDLLATAEAQRGELDAAEAWYQRARQLAEQINDRFQYVGTGRNLAILYQTRAEQAQNESQRNAYLQQAITLVQESVDGFLEMNDKINAAASYSQLGILHQRRGDLDVAEQNALKSLQIRESLDHLDTWKSYGILANIARARGDETSAAEWQAKAETKYAEIKRRERGEGASVPRVNQQLIKFLTELAQVSYAVRAQRAAIPPDLAEALAQLHEAPPPFNETGAFLQAAASGQALLPVPSGLPKQIELILDGLKEAIEELEKN